VKRKQLRPQSPEHLHDLRNWPAGSSAFWIDGKVTGNPQTVLNLPFAFAQRFGGNAYDIARDLSKIVYTRPGGQFDLYLLSRK
jgi:hypothetical protein